MDTLDSIIKRKDEIVITFNLTEEDFKHMLYWFENKLPLIQLIESAGANLLRQTDMFIKGGRSFANLAKMSAKGLPTIGVVHGSSTAGGAYQTGLSDYIIVVKERSKIFLAGPPLLKASTGEIATDEEIGGADLHYAVSGLAEYMAKDDAHAIEIARDVVKSIGWNNDFISTQKKDYNEPIYSPEELIGVVPVDYKVPYDCREVIARIVDGSEFLEFKEMDLLALFLDLFLYKSNRIMNFKLEELLLLQ